MDKLKITLIFLYLFKLFNFDLLLFIPKIAFVKGFNVSDKLYDSLEINVSRAKIIFGHSGYGTNSYFNNLVKLRRGNKIYFIDKKIYIYEVVFIKSFNKGSKITLDNNEKYLYLITCDINNLETKQVIIGSKLVKN